jgi:mannose-6-phosphate isomerase-like protein (cupin superfamily)
MERRTFIASSLATGLALNTLQTFALEPQKPFVVKAGKARFTAEQEPVQNTKISAKDTNGQLSAFENINELGPMAGPPLHIHPDQDETFFIIDGEFLFQVGNEKIKVGKGDVVFGPRKVPHTFYQTSKKGHMIFTYNPAGNMEEIFRGMSKLMQINPFPADKFAKLCAENGVNFVGPPMSGE